MSPAFVSMFQHPAKTGDIPDERYRSLQMRFPVTWFGIFLICGNFLIFLLWIVFAMRNELKSSIAELVSKANYRFVSDWHLRGQWDHNWSGLKSDGYWLLVPGTACGIAFYLLMRIRSKRRWNARSQENQNEKKTPN